MGSIAVIGGGAAGLMAAEHLAAKHTVTVYDHMPSLGRKFLMAGRGGLNLTHSEPLDLFLTRYGVASPWLAPAIQAFPPEAVRGWCHGLGQPTFVGTSGRIFPQSLKASPLLRAWLRRLDAAGVRFVLNRRWLGWDADHNLILAASDGTREKIIVDAALLALGGASWPRLGSDGNWMDILAPYAIPLTPLAPANSGFIAPWSEIFATKYAGRPLKPVTLTLGETRLQGELIITATGLEGGAIYAIGKPLRDVITANGNVTLTVDLRPGLTRSDLATQLQTARGGQSFTNYLRKHTGLPPQAIGLLLECTPRDKLSTLAPGDLATLIKACPVKLTAPAPIARAISTAGGVSREAVDKHYMLRKIPGIFACGEMLDWEAPTGGYLLQACFSTAVAAAKGIDNYITTKSAAA